MDHARKEVQIAKDRLIALSEEIEQQQQATGVLNPETDVKVIVSTLSALEQDLAATQAELDEKRGYMQEDSLQISSLKRSVDHLTDQISAQRSKLAGRDTQKETLAEISTSIALLEREMEFAAQALQGSLTTLEAAKLKAMQSRKNLVVIDHANENPIAEKPERVMTFLMILLVNILLTIGVRAISRIIKEG